MDGNGASRGQRTLSQIESDLLKAEEAFADADQRLKEAERDCNAAIESMNEYQMEMDKAVAEWRQRATLRSKWGNGSNGPEASLELRREDAIEDSHEAREPASTSATAQFDRLRAIVDSEGNNPE